MGPDLILHFRRSPFDLTVDNAGPVTGPPGFVGQDGDYVLTGLSNLATNEKLSASWIGRPRDGNGDDVHAHFERFFQIIDSGLEGLYRGKITEGVSIDEESEVIRGRNLQPGLLRDCRKKYFFAEVGDGGVGFGRFYPLGLSKVELMEIEVLIGMLDRSASPAAARPGNSFPGRLAPAEQPCRSIPQSPSAGRRLPPPYWR